MRASRDITTLIEIMAALRDPHTGCPWDREQDFASIAPYTVEEAYEVADAIERRDMDALKDELGDLLLQVVYHARMAEEDGAFDFGDVCHAIADKMIRRHPHVFGDDAGGIPRSWEAIKAEEKAARGESPASLLGDVPLALPALTRAVKLQRRAARVGFDWDDPVRVLDKVREETDELRDAIGGGDQGRIEEEIGDLLFALANVARHLAADPEAALRAANEKFRSRFAHIEARAAEAGRDLAEIGLDEMEGWWQEAKGMPER